MGNPENFHLAPTAGRREPVYVLARKLEAESRLTIADFPYDPTIIVDRTAYVGVVEAAAAVGITVDDLLEKLRAAQGDRVLYVFRFSQHPSAKLWTTPHALHAAAPEYFREPQHMSQLEGLDKLRGLDSEVDRRCLGTLYWLSEAREENGDAERDRRARAAKAAHEERNRLLSLSKACLGGHRGKAAKEIALHILRDPGGSMREDLQSLRAFEDELKKANAQRKGAA